MSTKNNQHAEIVNDDQGDFMQKNAMQNLTIDVDVKSDGGLDYPSRIDLTAAQKKFLNRLVSQMGRMEEAQKGAQKALEDAEYSLNLAQSNATEYVLVCAEEAEVPLGQFGWEFIQTQMAFIRQVGSLGDDAQA